MAVITTLIPTANQTPDATLGGLAVTGASNTGHSSTSAVASNGAFQAKSCRWHTFQSVSGQIRAITLKFDHTSTGSLIGGGSFNQFEVDYTLNGGGAWTTAVLREAYTFAQGPTTASIPLSATQDISQVQVRDLIVASTTDLGENAAATATMANIKLEVEFFQTGVVAMM